MSDAAPLYDLVKQLTDLGLTRTAVVQLLGYTASPERSLKAIVNGRGKISHENACKKLQLTIDGLNVADGDAPPGSAADPHEEKRFRKLIKRLQEFNVSAGAIAASLGYAGNPERCFAAIISGSSTKHTIASASDVLANQLANQLAYPESDDDVNTSDEADSDDPIAHAGDEERLAKLLDTDAAKESMSAEEMLAQRKNLFGRCLRFAVAKFQRKDTVPDHYVPPAWPTEDRPASLTEWYRTAERANAYMTPDGFKKLRADRGARASALAEGIVRAWPRVKGADGKGKVRVWLMDGAGYFFFEVLRVLKESWPTEIDNRVEFSLVDWAEAMNKYHGHAIPCATVLRGDIHALIKDCADCALPHCVYFNYSLTTTNGTTEGMYESDAFPGSNYDTGACMADTKASCSKLLGADADTRLLMLSFSAVRGGTGTEEKMREAFGDTLAATKVKSDRKAFVTFTVSKKE